MYQVTGERPGKRAAMKRRHVKRSAVNEGMDTRCIE